MIVCFRCTAETKAHLDFLLTTGAYLNIDEAVAAAIRNQTLMEKEVTENGAIVIGGQETTPPPTLEMTKGNGQQKPATRHAKNGALVRAQEKPCDLFIPPQFQLAGLSEMPKGLADLAPDTWLNRQIVPLDRWMLGQFNRLLPAKANARVLIRMFTENPKGLRLHETAGEIARLGASLGDYLRDVDTRSGTARDDALATAFPTSGGESEKSRGRYANQFVAYQTGKGDLSGLLVDLKFIHVATRGKDCFLIPTTMAWEFATLRNPILDERTSTPKFSPEERAFLLRHIAASVPAEAFAYHAILGALREGHTTPEKLDKAIRSYLAAERADTLSESFLASQRSGAVSRMSDLGLVAREREGVRVSYQITDAGVAFLGEGLRAQS